MAGTALYTPTIESFVIEGGSSLNGRIAASGNKNAALPILAACLLTAEPVTLTNVPRIRDVEAMLALLRGLGVSVDWRGPNEIVLDASGASADIALDRDAADRIRASFLLAGPLLSPWNGRGPRGGRTRAP
jgi:UDP-N-acetylglucosamine 1-carboxyvinyltransferase